MANENSPKRKPKSGRVFPGPHHLRNKNQLIHLVGPLGEDPLCEHLAWELEDDVCDVEAAGKGVTVKSWNAEPKSHLQRSLTYEVRRML